LLEQVDADVPQGKCEIGGEENPGDVGLLAPYKETDN
jgi:hypothetical protein